MKKRILSLFLILLIVLGSFCGCSKDPANIPGSSTADSSDSDRTPTGEYAYQATFSALTEEMFHNQYPDEILSFCVSEHTAFFTAKCLIGDNQSGTYTDPVTGEEYEYTAQYSTELFALDLASMQIKQMPYSPTPMKEGREGSYTISEVFAGMDNSVWLIETLDTYYFDLPSDFDENIDSVWNYYTTDIPQITLLHFSADGELLTSSQLSVPAETGAFTEIMADKDGNVYAAGDSAVYLFDATGVLLSQLEEGKGMMTNFGPNGIGYMSNTSLQMIDPQLKSYAEPITVDGAAWFISGGNKDYLYTYVSHDAVYGFNAQNGSEIQIVDWLFCDINSSNIISYSIADNGTIIALERNGSVFQIITMSLVDTSLLPVCEEITLATMNLSDQLKEDIIAFNRTNDDVRVTVKDYYVTDADGKTGLERLNEDLASDHAPDILMTANVPFLRYAEDGLLVDLWTMIDSDSSLSRNDLMQHLFEVVSIDGKLYEIAPWFTVSTTAGNREVIGEREQWTVDDISAAVQTLEDGATAFGPNGASIVKKHLMNGLSDFIDYTAKNSFFDTEEFEKLLDFYAKSEEINENTSGKKSSDYRRLASNMQLLTSCELDGLYAVKYANAMHRSKVNFVGFPTGSGSGSRFTLIDPIAITKSCSNKALAWEFVRTYLTGNYQTEQASRGFPTNSTVFEAYAENLMTPVYETDAAGQKVEITNGSMKLDDIITLELYAVTEEEYDLFMKLYERCDKITRNDPMLIEIVNTELTAMLENAATAQDTAAAIQTAVDNYLS